MPSISPKLIAAAAAAAAVATAAAVAAGAFTLTRGSDTPSTSTPPQSAIETPQQQSPSGLPTCQSATATSCDRANLAQSAGTRGSAACSGKGTATIGASPIDLDEIAFIEPMGLMIGGHVTPIDHGYFYIKGAVQQPHHQALVRSPFAGVITAVSRSVRRREGADYDDYALTIEATCTFRIRYSNLVSLSGALAAAVGQLEPNGSATPNLKVTEGEAIGYTGLPTANGIDVWLENDELTLPGFVNPAQYATTESWKLHMADLFDYTSEPLKAQLLALDMRDASPRWGKIDYDIDGRLVGNWFREGTGGYRGLQQGSEGYWDGHLAVAYNGNDPTAINISFGSYLGEAQQFAVIGNAPDPATVTVATGPVAYQLGQITYYSGDTGAPWDHASYIPHVRVRANTTVVGTVLLQLTDDQHLKMEIFPGSSQTTPTFTPAAQTYER